MFVYLFVFAYCASARVCKYAVFFTVCVFGLWQQLNIDERPFHTPFPWLLGLGGTAAWHCTLRQRKNSSVLVFKCKTPFSKQREKCSMCPSLMALLKHCSTSGHASHGNTQFFYTGLKYRHRCHHILSAYPAPFIPLTQFMNHPIDHNWTFAQAVYV